MAKHASELPVQTDEQETFTKEDVQKIVAEERKRQFIADDTRIHGNAFFAEALDHIGTLAARDPFWKRVYQFGTMFKNQFEINSGQAAPAAPQEKVAPAKSAAKPNPENTAGSTEDETTSDEEQNG